MCNDFDCACACHVFLDPATTLFSNYIFTKQLCFFKQKSEYQKQLNIRGTKYTEDAHIPTHKATTTTRLAACYATL